jgi:enolase
MTSQRSGETPDPFMTDFAVGPGAVRSTPGPARGERVAKYNRLIEIERELPGDPFGLLQLPDVPTAVSGTIVGGR